MCARSACQALDTNLRVKYRYDRHTTTAISSPTAYSFASMRPTGNEYPKCWIAIDRYPTKCHPVWFCIYCQRFDTTKRFRIAESRAIWKWERHRCTAPNLIAKASNASMLGSPKMDSCSIGWDLHSIIRHYLSRWVFVNTLGNFPDLRVGQYSNHQARPEAGWEIRNQQKPGNRMRIQLRVTEVTRWSFTHWRFRCQLKEEKEKRFIYNTPQRPHRALIIAKVTNQDDCLPSTWYYSLDPTRSPATAMVLIAYANPTSRPLQIYSTNSKCTWSRTKANKLIRICSRVKTARERTHTHLNEGHSSRYLLAVIARLPRRRRFYQMIDVVDLHDAALDERINLFDCHHLSQDIAQPLRVQEIEISQRCVVVMEQNTVFVQEHRRLLQFGRISERLEIQVVHFLVDHLLESLLIQHRVGANMLQICTDIFDDIFQCQIARRHLLMQQNLFRTDRS